MINQELKDFDDGHSFDSNRYNDVAGGCYETPSDVTSVEANK